MSNFRDIVMLMVSTFDAGAINADEFARLKAKAPA
jgi:hypothetical protein